MHYYIDGYNLLFRAFGASVDDFKTRRNSLISSLNVKIGTLKLDVTVVFDSQYLEGEGSRSHYKHLEICFTPLGMTADEFILDQLKFCNAPQKEVVITSDRDLAYKARNYSASTESIDEFLGWLNKRYKKKENSRYSVKAPLAKKKGEIPAAKKEGDPNNPVEQPVIEKVVTPAEGTFEFYMWQFEEKLKTLNIPEPIKKSTSETKLKIKKKPKSERPKEEHPHLTEEERWLKIFQDRFKEEQPH